MIIAVNAGHYPTVDSGALGTYSNEAELVRDIAKIVCDDLNKVGYNALFIQEDSLSDIASIANNANADLFVSIHLNACNNIAQGTETWYHDGSTKGIKLADCIQSQLVNTMNSINRGIKVDTSRYTNGFAVLRLTDMPAVLTEVDFIDNPNREYYINTNKDLIAHAIARGITDYVAQN